jgi:hypothetical protein
MECRFKIAVMVLTVLLSGCFEKAETVTYFVSTHEQLMHCNTRPTPVAREDCYMEAALEHSKPALCGQLSNRSIRNACHFRLGRKIKDAGLCETIEFDEDLRSKCVFAATTY